MSEAIEQAEVKPYLRDDGSICIPLNGLDKYKHWKLEGQSIFTTLAELNAPAETFKRMGYNSKNSGDTCVCEKTAGTVGQIHYCTSCLFWWEKGSTQ